MTQNHYLNKSPRANDLVQSFKSAWLLPLISFALFATYYVIKLIEQIKNIDVSEYKYVFSPEHSQLVSRNFLVSAIFIISILSAIFAFRFFSSKKKINVYLSLAVDRKTLFFNRAFANISLLFLSFFLPLLIDLFINIGKFGISKELLGVFMFSLGGYSAIVLVAFAFGTIAVSITGSVVESFLAGVSLAFLPKMIISFVFDIFDVFLYGKGFNNLYAPNKFDFLYLDPFSFLTRQNVSNDTTEVYGTLKFDSYFPTTATIKDFFIVFVWLGIGIALLFLGNKLIRHKKVENVGILGANNSSNILIATFVLFLTSYIAPLFLRYEKEFNKQISTLCITIAIMVVAYFVTMIILTRNVKKMALCGSIVPAYVFLIIAVFGIATTGCFGYSSRLPNQASVEKAYVSLPAATSFYNNLPTEYYNYSINTQDYYTSTMGPFESVKDIKKIIELNGLVTEKNDNDRGLVKITYYMKDGSVLVREYNMVKKDTQKQFFSLIDTDYGKSYIKKIFSDDSKLLQNQYSQKFIEDMSKAFDKQIRTKGRSLLEDENLFAKNKEVIGYDTGNATLVSNDGSAQVLLNERLSVEEYKQLKENIVADLQSMTYEQRCLNKVAPSGTIKFLEKSDDEKNDFRDGQSFMFVALYPEMTKTINFLNEKKLLEEIKVKQPKKAYVISNRSKDFKVTPSANSDSMYSYMTEYLNPFAGYVENPKKGMNFVDEIFALKNIGHNVVDNNASENANAINRSMSIENIEFLQNTFKNAQNITDVTQLSTLSKLCSPMGYAEDEVYYVLLEYDGFVTTMLLDKTQAPDFINK